MTIRLNKVTRDLNVGLSTVVEFLQKKGYDIESNPNTKITEEEYGLLVKEFSTDKSLRMESDRFTQQRQTKERKSSVSIEGYQFEKDKEKQKKENVIKTVIPSEARPHVKDTPYTTPAEIGPKIGARAYCRHLIFSRPLLRTILNDTLQMVESPFSQKRVYSIHPDKQLIRDESFRASECDNPSA